ncbi:MAG TPA: NAD(P)H nitroreductase, partial [Mycobacterium sp.]|nr:NAD(P)H nitroreductase [Mycobacterium sp.]
MNVQCDARNMRDVGFPDTETIRTALLLASRAPSVHNSQPWRWRVYESALELFAEPSLQLRSVDPDGRGLILSSGAALNHCVVALAALGWQSRVRRLPDPSDANHLATIEVCRREAEQVDVTLAAAIPRRRTDRRHYSRWPVSA